MKPDPSLPWNEMLRRSLQSIRDTAAALAHGEHGLSDWCNECAGDELLIFADAHSGQPERLPHWLAHALREMLADIRLELLWKLLAHPLGDGDVGDAIAGIGELPRDTWTPLQQEANRIVNDHHAIIDCWQRIELRTLAPWMARILQAGSRRPQDLRVASRYLERLILNDPNAAWITAVQPLTPQRAISTGCPATELQGGSDRVREANIPELLPRWLTPVERQEITLRLEADLQRQMKRQRHSLTRAARQIIDPDERRAELLIAEAECEQTA